jgi:hypothetical protein
MSEPIKVPAEDFMHVAEVIRRLTEGGVPMSDMFIGVTSRQLELLDETGSYGIRLFGSAS